MAARDQRNLRKHNNRLYQQTWRALETYVPKRVDGRKGVVGLSYSGRDSKYLINGNASPRIFLIQEGSAFYNAYEKDIAVVNIFFGGPTAFGKDTPAKNIKFHTFPKSLRDPKEWPGSTSSLTWEVSVVFVLASALCLLLSLHIGL